MPTNVNDDALLPLILTDDAFFYEEDFTYSLAIAGIALVLYGADKSRQLRAQRRAATRLYLRRRELLTNPRHDTPWKALYASKSDRGFYHDHGLQCGSFPNVSGPTLMACLWAG
jgi:hypothetical protein